MFNSHTRGGRHWQAGFGLASMLAFGYVAAAAAQTQVAPAKQGAVAPSSTPKVTIVLKQATPAAAARQVAEAAGLTVSGIELLEAVDRPINFSFTDTDAKVALELIADVAEVNVVMGNGKVLFSKR